MNLNYGGDPWMWISRDGFPAYIVGDPRRFWQTGGLPSAETDDGFQVYSLNYVFYNGLTGRPRMFPLDYGDWCDRHVGGPVACHPNGKAMYRPCVWTWDDQYECWERKGSQRELQWRHALGETRVLGDLRKRNPAAAEFEFEFQRFKEQLAEARAERLLDSMLGPSQLLERRTAERFRVVGGETGHFYRVELGNGFARVDPYSNQPIVHYCLHPEDWMPDADVALSIKLHLEDPELERETLEGANSRDKNERRVPPTQDELAGWRYATDQERELIAA